MSTALSVKDLRKVYPQNCVAVNDISFNLRDGEILGLLGPNGSGKTTTIQMLLGTLTPTSGSIFYFGKDFKHNRSDVLQHVTFASTYTSLPWLLTIAENLEVFGYLYGLSKQESHRRFEPLLERFGILNKKDARVSGLSAGQITRLMLVKAFFVKPRIALLDEPTASLDPDVARDICSFILEERQKRGMSILFSSHKMEEVMEICDRAIFLKEGKIIADDVPKVLAKSVSSFVVKLVIVDGLKRVTALAKECGYLITATHRHVEIQMEEERIPSFLDTLSQKQVSYATIKIEEPSLEDYFLQITKKQL